MLKRFSPLSVSPLLASPLLVSMILTGCTGEDWRTSDISEIMPPLDFELINEQGATVTEKDYEGKPALLFFGYTHCPDICPTTLARLTRITQQLDEDLRDDLQVLFVSVDPERDAPETLATYTAAFGPQFIGLTGDKAQLDEVTNRYRTSYSLDEPDENGNYTVSHSSAVMAFDSQGHPAFLTRDSDPIEDARTDIRHLVEASQGS